MSDLKIVKLIWCLILNNGPKESSITNVSGSTQDRQGIYTLDTRATIFVETKKELTTKEKRRKRLIVGFVVSIILMVVLSATGGWLPDADAQLGRELMLVSEVPAFASSLFATRILLKERKAGL
ncbi:MAG: hypothetical protein PXY39_08715 [archaeon]|nr:hypothetical protein [archaeon]